MNILMLQVEASKFVGTTKEHLDAFLKYSKHNIVQWDITSFKKRNVNISMFDCIVFHHSIPIGYGSYISDDFAKKINSFKGLKALLIQDEMRWVNSTCEKIQKLGVSLIFTVVNKDIVRDIYRGPYFDNVRFEHVLTGYVPEALLGLNLPKYEDRSIDVSYRARKLPAWYGRFGQEKSRIAEGFLEKIKDEDLHCDISCAEKDRIYGDRWIEFVSNSKATLGAESGASFIDYTGEVGPTIEAYAERHPEASFEELSDKFLEGRDGKTVIHVISPRCFEAAALKTLMIMYEGTYSDVLEPGRHYVMLKRDHSNIQDVVDVLRDPQKAGEIIENAYRDVACSGRWSYESLIKQFDDAVFLAWKEKGVSAAQEWTSAQLQDILKRSKKFVTFNDRRYKVAFWMSQKYQGLLDAVDRNFSPPFVRFLKRLILIVTKPLRVLMRFLLVD